MSVNRDALEAVISELGVGGTLTLLVDILIQRAKKESEPERRKTAISVAQAVSRARDAAL